MLYVALVVFASALNCNFSFAADKAVRDATGVLSADCVVVACGRIEDTFSH